MLELYDDNMREKELSKKGVILEPRVQKLLHIQEHFSKRNVKHILPYLFITNIKQNTNKTK